MTKTIKTNKELKKFLMSSDNTITIEEAKKRHSKIFK